MTSPPKNPISPVTNGSISLVPSGPAKREIAIRKVPQATINATTFPRVVKPLDHGRGQKGLRVLDVSSPVLISYLMEIVILLVAKLLT